MGKDDFWERHKVGTPVPQGSTLRWQSWNGRPDETGTRAGHRGAQRCHHSARGTSCKSNCGKNLGGPDSPAKITVGGHRGQHLGHSTALLKTGEQPGRGREERQEAAQAPGHRADSLFCRDRLSWAATKGEKVQGSQATVPCSCWPWNKGGTLGLILCGIRSTWRKKKCC